MNQANTSPERRRDGVDPRVLVVRGENEHLDTIDLVEEIASDRTEVAVDRERDVYVRASCHGRVKPARRSWS